MKLSPREVEKLMLHNAGFLAQKCLTRDSRLNYTEAVALIATQCEGLANYLTRSVSQSVRSVMSKGNQCYEVTLSTPDMFPTVNLNFPGGASMFLRPQDYLLQQNSVRHGLCCLILVQHSFDCGFDDEMALAHGASCVGSHVTAMVTCDWTNNTRSRDVAHTAMYDVVVMIQ
ncbi:aspartic proteinase-like protein 2 [Tanacetum coccineum]